MKRTNKILVTFQALLLTTTYLLPLILSDSANPTGSFNLGNVAPTAPTVFGVQDTSNAGVRDTATPDTHMIYTDLFNISWVASTDSNGDTIYYRLCIASSESNRNAENCDILNKMSNTSALSTNYYVTTGSDTGLTYDGVSKTFYTRVIATDKKGTDENSTAYDSSFDILNSAPICVAIFFTPAEVHGNLAPNLNWDDCTDPDDGTADHYPADTLVYTVKVGDSTYGDTERLSKSNLATSEYTGSYDSNLVYGSSESSGWANKTYYVRITANDQQGASNSVSGDVDKDSVLYDYLTDVTNVEVTDAGQPYTNKYLTPVEKLKSATAVKITATDTDGDCATTNSHIAYIHLCLNATEGETCDQTNYDQVWEVEDESGSSGSTCVFVFTVNKTTANGFPTFWTAPAIYKVNVNVTTSGVYGSTIKRATDTQRDGTWEFKSLQGIEYTTTVALGTLLMGQWNSGLSKYILNNTGNIVMNIRWNASDFVNGTDTTSIDSLSTFQIDDDNIANETSETLLTPLTLNTTERTTSTRFQPASGLPKCDDDACAGDGLNTYYHMNLENGLPALIYTNIINLETEAY